MNSGLYIYIFFLVVVFVFQSLNVVNSLAAGTPLVLPGGKDNERGEKAANSGRSAETSAKAGGRG